jgi:sugar phosphate isomerase/epimerase
MTERLFPGIIDPFSQDSAMEPDFKAGNGRESDVHRLPAPSLSIFPAYLPIRKGIPMFFKQSGATPIWTRRQMLQATGCLTVGAVFNKTMLATTEVLAADSAKSTIMQVGVLLGVFPRPTFGAQLDAAKAQGLECVQVAMDSVGLPFMPDAIPIEAIERLRRETAARNIKLSALQGTFNMAHPDPKERETGLRQLRVMVEACPKMGVEFIHICTGTRNRNYIWSGHPDNGTPEAWRDMVDCVRKATKIAEEANVILAFEPEVSNIVNSPEKARKILDDIGSPKLKVTMDGANVFPKGGLNRQAEVLDHAFELIGKDIVMAHAKDLDHDGAAGELPAGRGKLDYDRYLSLLHRYGFRGPILLHSLSETDVPGCVKFLREKLAKIG